MGHKSIFAKETNQMLEILIKMQIWPMTLFRIGKTAKKQLNVATAIRTTWNNLWYAVKVVGAIILLADWVHGRHISF